MMTEPATAEKLGLTPSQTVGPFLRIALNWQDESSVVPAGTPGAVTIGGRLFDGAGEPVPDGVVETWQADPAGRFAHSDDPRGAVDSGIPGFRGFGRSLTDRYGGFRFTTIKPGPVPGPGGTLQAPHIVVTVFMRGLLKHLFTRVYFPDEPANAEDPVLKLVPAERRATLIARRVPGEKSALEWNVVVQGQDETVFFDC